MWSFASALRLPLRPLRARWLVVPAVLALAGCSPDPAARALAPLRCFDVGSAHGGTLQVALRLDSTSVVRIQERGMTVAARIDAAFDGAPRAPVDLRTAADAAESAVERYGSMLLTPAAVGNRMLRIQSLDSPEISAEVCTSVQELNAPTGPSMRAARAFAAAGLAVHAHDWKAAFAALATAARDYDALGQRGAAAEARHAMAELAYRRLDRKADSFALANEALTAPRSGRDPVRVGLLLALQAKALLDMPGSAPRAVAPRVRQLLSQARGDFAGSRFGAREIARLDIMSGFLEYRLDAPEQARGFFTRAAQLCRGLQDRDCYATASQNLALLAEADRNYAFALAAYADALRTLGPELNPKLAADIWNNLGRLQGVAGLFSRSASSQATAMRGYARLQDCPGVRRALSRSGNLLVQVGSLSDAESELQQAASLSCPQLFSYVARLQDPGLGPAAPAVAAVTATRERASPASSPAQLCTTPLQPTNLTDDNKAIVFNSLLSLGDALMLEGEAPRARSCLLQAQSYAATSRSRIRLENARGAALLERDDALNARAAFAQALRLANDAKLPPAYEHRGTAQLGIARAALLAGDPSQALRDAAAALHASVTRGDIDQTVGSLRLVAAAYRTSGNRSAAARTLQAAVHLIEAVPIDGLDGEKRATYLATQHAVFTEWTDLFATDAIDATDATGDDAWTAFANSERGRARSLRYAELQQQQDVSSPTPTAATPAPTPKAPAADTPAARYPQLLRDVVQLSRPGAMAPSVLVDQLDAVALHAERHSDTLDRSKLARTLAQLDATLLEYAVGIHDMFAFILDEGGLRVVRLGDRRDIARIAGELRDRLRNSEASREDLRTDAQRLARIVLWPLTAQLTHRRILIVPDEALHTVPFSILPWSSSSADELLLQHAEVTIVPSAAFLAGLRRRPHKLAPRFELIGNPVFRIADWRRECATTAAAPAPGSRLERSLADWAQSLPRLPGSAEETLMVARLARESRPDSHIETLLGCAAVPSALRTAANSNPDLLHIATHARIDAQRPRLSALALTPESVDGQPVSMFGLLDILGLKLHSPLVVLSACDTSRGRLLPGEGVLGPAQAFLQAGAAAVLASYWRIDDQATAQFMQQFYRHLLLEHLPAGAALRRTQLEQAAQAASLDWAAFALYGWPDSSV
ncbi:MAG TPA: CHAT domain-containing protein [Steroidobacteraceae bacterium]